jgi:hypothetical protein
MKVIVVSWQSRSSPNLTASSQTSNFSSFVAVKKATEACVHLNLRIFSTKETIMIHHPFTHTFTGWKTLAGVFALLVLISSSAFAQAPPPCLAKREQSWCEYRLVTKQTTTAIQCFT